MTVRYERVEPCVHGKQRCTIFYIKSGMSTQCPGGSRTPLKPTELLAELGLNCGEPSPETYSLCVLPPGEAAHHAGHESAYVNSSRAVWSTTGISWWERLALLVIPGDET